MTQPKPAPRAAQRTRVMPTIRASGCSTPRFYIENAQVLALLSNCATNLSSTASERRCPSV